MNRAADPGMEVAIVEAVEMEPGKFMRRRHTPSKGYQVDDEAWFQD